MTRGNVAKVPLLLLLTLFSFVRRALSPPRRAFSGEFTWNFAEFFCETNSGIIKEHLNCGRTDFFYNFLIAKTAEFSRKSGSVKFAKFGKKLVRWGIMAIYILPFLGYILIWGGFIIWVFGMNFDLPISHLNFFKYLFILNEKDYLFRFFLDALLLIELGE